MLKTIKTTGKLNLHELIKYAWENGLENKTFRSSNGIDVKFHSGGNFNIEYNCAILADSIFTVEIEEPITEDTEFVWLIRTYGMATPSNVDVYHRKTINEIKNGATNRIFALINENIELVWERDGDE